MSARLPGSAPRHQGGKIPRHGAGTRRRPEPWDRSACYGRARSPTPHMRHSAMALELWPPVSRTRAPPAEWLSGRRSATPAVPRPRKALITTVAAIAAARTPRATRAPHHSRYPFWSAGCTGPPEACLPSSSGYPEICRSVRRPDLAPRPFHGGSSAASCCVYPPCPPDVDRCDHAGVRRQPGNAPCCPTIQPSAGRPPKRTHLDYGRHRPPPRSHRPFTAASHDLWPLSATRISSQRSR